MRERGETGEHATKVTYVWRKRVVAWGQYGKKLGLDGHGSGLSLLEKKNLDEGNPGSSKADPLARAPLPDGVSVPQGFPNDVVARPSAPCSTVEQS